MIEVIRYTKDKKDEWDKFVEIADCNFFFFKRNFIEYHKSRFEDYSLMLYSNKKLVSIFPANINEDTVFSHQGLTYGGLISIKKNFFSDLKQYIITILKHLKTNHINQLLIKTIPSVYFHKKANNLEVFLNNNSIYPSDTKVGAILDHSRYKMPSRRRLRIPAYIEENYGYKDYPDIISFWKFIESNYYSRYGFKPVHSLNEIIELYKNFPQNIKLKVITKKNSNKILAALMLFESKMLDKFQYIAYTDEAHEKSLIALLYYNTVKDAVLSRKDIDWGHSMDALDGELNYSILRLKEKFGAGTISMNTYRIDINNSHFS